jgi:DNA polymerase IIIc chi subunit
MTEILFYHLTESKLEDALPPLLEKSLERGWKVAIQTVGEERRDFLDTHLWTFRDDSFLPHVASARDLGVEPTIVRLPGIALDVDQPEDVQALLQAKPPMATHAMQVLANYSAATTLRGGV